MPERVVEVGEEAVADVVDLAGQQVDDRARPLGRQRRLAQPVHLAVDLAAERRRHVARPPRPGPTRRYCAIRQRARSRPEARRQQGGQRAPTLFGSVGTRPRTRSSSRAPARWSGLGLDEVGGDQREQAGVVEERDVLDPVPVTAALRPRSGSESQLGRTAVAPRPAWPAAPPAGPTTVSSARISSEWTDPEDAGPSPPRSGRSLRSLRARAIRVRMHASNPMRTRVSRAMAWAPPIAASGRGPAWRSTASESRHRARRGQRREPAYSGPAHARRSGQVAILEQEEREQQRCSTVQHAIAQCRNDVPHPGDHRPGRDRRAGVEELQRRAGPRRTAAP